MKKSVRALLPFFFLISCLGVDTSVEEAPAGEETSVLNIQNNSQFPISELYLKADVSADSDKNFLQGPIIPGDLGSFTLPSGKYNMTVVFDVYGQPVSMLYEEILLPDFEYNWAIDDSQIEMPYEYDDIFEDIEPWDQPQDDYYYDYGDYYDPYGYYYDDYYDYYDPYGYYYDYYDPYGYYYDYYDPYGYMYKPGEEDPSLLAIAGKLIRNLINEIFG